MNSRRGFTLIEMLVATALTLFLMVIISEAFVTALDTFSGLKAIGDMEEGIRTASTLLRFDLQQNHFEGTRKLSDMNIGTLPPQLGFFCVRQGVAPGSLNFNTSALQPGQPEGYDSEFAPGGTFLPVYYANGPYGTPGGPVAGSNHTLHFTVRLSGNQPNSFYSTAVPVNRPASSALVPFSGPGTQNPSYVVTNSQPFDGLYQPIPPAGASFANYNSPWAEVAYYLVFQGTTADPHNPNAVVVPGASIPLYRLMRVQIVAPSSNASSAASADNGAGLQWTNVAAFSPGDMAVAPNVSYIVSGGQPTGYTLAYNRAFDQTVIANSPNYVPNLSPAAPSVLSPGTLLFNIVSFNVRIYRSIPGVTSVNGVPMSNTVSVPVAQPDNIPSEVVTPAQGDWLASPDSVQFPRQAFDTTSGAGPSAPTAGNPSFTSQNGTASTLSVSGVFDRNASATINAAATTCFPVSAIEITLRVWDQKTQQTRQITLIQDM